MKRMPAEPLLDAERLQRDARPEAARAGRPGAHNVDAGRQAGARAETDQQRVRLDADRRRIEASRDVMAVLDVLQASTSGVGVGVDDLRRLQVKRRPVADDPGEEQTECGRVLVVLILHNISAVEVV